MSSRLTAALASHLLLIPGSYDTWQNTIHSKLRICRVLATLEAPLGRVAVALEPPLPPTSSSTKADTTKRFTNDKNASAVANAHAELEEALLRDAMAQEIIRANLNQPDLARIEPDSKASARLSPYRKCSK